MPLLTRRRPRAGILIATVVLACGWPWQQARAADWARFRGPNGSGISGDSLPVPTTWSPAENLRWKLELPGPGSSSPIVVGRRIFVTCWTGYGTDRSDPGDQTDLRRHLICIDRQSGKILWTRSIEPVLPEDAYQGMFAEHGYASHTPVSDGARVYVYFGKTGALAFDLDGQRLWHTVVGTESDPRGWGSASSPILFEDTMIVTASAECEGLVGLDAATGAELWRQEAAGLNATWGTPILVWLDAGRTDLVLAVPNEIWGCNPRTGRLRWYCQGMQSDSYCSSVVADGDTVFAIEGRPGGGLAVRAGGNGDVTNSHLVWSKPHRNRISTPLVFEGLVYFNARGVISCVDTVSGKERYQVRLEEADVSGAPDSERARGAAGPATDGGGRRRFGSGGGFGGDYASPVLADGKLYFLSRTGDVFVVQSGETFQLLAANRVTDEIEDFSATPALSQGEMFLRSNRHLYCVSSEPTGAGSAPAAGGE